jgi:hypothetical protein
MTVLGILFILAGIATGIYIGGYLCLYKSIIDIISAISTHNIVPANIAWDIIKIIFCALIGQLSALFLIIPGYAMLIDRKY